MTTRELNGYDRIVKLVTVCLPTAMSMIVGVAVLWTNAQMAFLYRDVIAPLSERIVRIEESNKARDAWLTRMEEAQNEILCLLRNEKSLTSAPSDFTLPKG